MAMKKCFFPLTAFLSEHSEYGEIWNLIFHEYELTLRYIFLLTDKNELMADYPVDQMSIQMRERIVLPLTTIQQYAMCRIRGRKRCFKRIFRKISGTMFIWNNQCRKKLCIIKEALYSASFSLLHLWTEPIEETLSD
jgi:hypothetical protein